MKLSLGVFSPDVLTRVPAVARDCSGALVVEGHLAGDSPHRQNNARIAESRTVIERWLVRW
jgi:hypothetical protein